MAKLSGKKELFAFLILPSLISEIGSLIGIIINQIGVRIFISDFLYLIVLFIGYVPFIYGLYPAFVKIEKFFSKKGYANVVLEHQFIRQLLLFLIPLYIISNLVPTIILVFFSDTYSSYSSLFLYMLPFSTVIHLLTVGSILRIVTLRVKKEFGYFFAKGYCILIYEKKNEVEKLNYLNHLLSAYNNYLQRNLKIQIKDIEKIYSIILFKNIDERNQIISNICDTLENDRLDLGRYLKSLYKVSESEFYVKESLIKSLKVVGAIVVAAVPIIISIIQLTNEFK